MESIITMLFIIIMSMFTYNIIIMLKESKNCKTIYILENENYEIDEFEYSKI